MTKSKSKMKAIAKLIAIVPLLLISVYLISCSHKKKAANVNSVKNNKSKNKSVNAKTLNDKNNEEIIYSIVDEMPEFEGGDLGLRKYIAMNIRYPIEAIKKGIRGRVYVRFVVDTKGKVKNVEIIKSVHRLLDEEAIRVIKSLPQWKPGKQKGVAVPVYYTLPINFMSK